MAGSAFLVHGNASHDQRDRRAEYSLPFANTKLLHDVNNLSSKSKFNHFLKLNSTISSLISKHEHVLHHAYQTFQVKDDFM